MVAKKPTLAEISELLRREMPRLRTDYQVSSLGIFGSYARGDNTSDSDVDLLVTYELIPGLLKFIELQYELSDLLGINVDLVMKESLKLGIQQNVFQDLLEL